MANKNSKKWQKILTSDQNYISWGLGILAVIIVGILIFNYFQRAGQPAPEISEGQKQEISTPSGQVKPGEKAEFKPVPLPIKHTVAAGENLWVIAERYYNSGYNWIDVARENKLVNPDVIHAGNVLEIPKVEAKILPKTGVSTDKYTVQKGDTLWTIAEKFYGNGFDWVKIDQANKLGRLPNGKPLIHSGNVLVIPR